MAMNVDMSAMPTFKDTWNNFSSFLYNRDKSSDGTYRGLGADWFNATNIAKEDYERGLAQMREQASLNESAAQKQREWETQMSNTAYSRAIDDMKRAGLNPLLAISNGGASTPSGASGSTSGSYSNSTAGQSSTGEAVNSLSAIARLVAGIYTAGATNATKLKTAGIYATARTAPAQTYFKRTKSGWVQDKIYY